MVRPVMILFYKPCKSAYEKQLVLRIMVKALETNYFARSCMGSISEICNVLTLTLSVYGT